MPTEKDLQKKAEKYLRDKGIRYFHYQKYSNHRYDTNPQFKGLPDLFVFLNKQLIVIEFKMKGKELGMYQEFWKKYLTNCDYVVYDIIYTYEDFIEIMEGYV